MRAMDNVKRSERNSVKKELVERIVDAGLTPPMRVTLCITNGCNLRCDHCWPDSLISGISHPVPAGAVMRLIEEFAELGVEELCVTGGEPLVHPQWSEILAFCATSFHFREVCLQTNATLLTEDKISILCDPALKSLIVQVSLDGATSAAHEHVRGPQCFDRTLRALEMLAAAGLGARTRVAFTEMEHNFDELPRLLEIMDEIGIGKVVAGTLINGGRASNGNRLAPPAPFQYERLISRYLSDERFRAVYERVGEIAAIQWFKGKSHDAARGCCSFLGRPYVTADGRMFPCTMLQADKFALLGVFERPLAEALPEALPMWAELLAVSRRRPSELDSCSGCAGRTHCAGGCMGRALTAHGDLMTVEDRCALRKAVYNGARDRAE